MRLFEKGDLTLSKPLKKSLMRILFLKTTVLHCGGGQRRKGGGRTSQLTGTPGVFERERKVEHWAEVVGVRAHAHVTGLLSICSRQVRRLHSMDPDSVPRGRWLRVPYLLDSLAGLVGSHLAFVKRVWRCSLARF